jgi:hypothetical protein
MVVPRRSDSGPWRCEPALATVLALQRAVGNAAVSALLARRPGRQAPAVAVQRVTTGETLTADKAVARAKLDPLLQRYMVGQALADVKSESVNRLYRSSRRQP